ncbi:MAG: hypothetical protein PF495_13300, partial [Spirochaetales bacterium]|nr:hypothetical protein [Spirochaetales bacterium]
MSNILENYKAIEKLKERKRSNSTGATLLAEAVKEHTDGGCYDASKSLGIQTMPPGYALMLNADHTHFYWLRFDGMESVISWD